MNARLARLDLKTGCERHRSSRVTAETTQRRRDRIERAVNNIGGTRVAGRKGQRFRGGVITQAMFGDGLLAGLADPCNSFSPRAEGPLGVASGSRIRCLGPPQSMCMRGLRLRFKLRGVALPADLAAGISRSRVLAGNGHGAPGEYQRGETSKRNHWRGFCSHRNSFISAFAASPARGKCPSVQIGWRMTSPSLSIGPQDTRTPTAAQAESV
jgi:hypothetical protein